MEEKIDKFKVAEAQLITAIKLFFEDGNNVAIHTLARASHEILDNLCAHKNLTRGVINEGLKFIKHEHHKEVIAKVNDAKNFFKHADEDPEEILSWNPKVSEYFIWDATSLHRRLTDGKQAGEIIIYCLWFRLHHDDLWDESSRLDELLPNTKTELTELGGLSREKFFQTAMIAWRRGAFDQNVLQL